MALHYLYGYLKTEYVEQYIETLGIKLSHLAPSMRSLHACICNLFEGKPTQDMYEPLRLCKMS